MNFRGLKTVFFKELKDLFRDKKTVLVGIILPLVIFPVIFGIMGKSIDSEKKKVTDNLKISIQDNKNSDIGKFIKSQKGTAVVESSELRKDVMDGKIYLGIIIPDDCEAKMMAGEQGDMKLIYDNSSSSSELALNMVKSSLEAYSKEVVKQRLQAKGIDIKILSPINMQEEVAVKEKESSGRAKLMLSFMLPLFLLIYAMSSPMAAAVDLGAGEKERGTLEPLLTTQVNRIQLLFGKLFAITVMGLLGTIASIIGLIISFKVGGAAMGGGSGSSAQFLISNKALALIGITTLLLIMMAGALELAISIYARSFKEAQTYLSPVMIVSFIPAYGTYMMDVKTVSTALFNVPLVNAALVLKEFVMEIYNPTHIIITFVWLMVYILLAVLFARYMFSKEEVVFRT